MDACFAILVESYSLLIIFFSCSHQYLERISYLQPRDPSRRRWFRWFTIGLRKRSFSLLRKGLLWFSYPCQCTSCRFLSFQVLTLLLYYRIAVMRRPWRRLDNVHVVRIQLMPSPTVWAAWYPILMACLTKPLHSRWWTVNFFIFVPVNLLVWK